MKDDILVQPRVSVSMVEALPFGNSKSFSKIRVAAVITTKRGEAFEIQNPPNVLFCLRFTMDMDDAEMRIPTNDTL
jgi:hypothetical protein